MKQHSLVSSKAQNETLAQRTFLTQCPITAGQRTKMKKSSFETLCEQRQTLANNGSKSALKKQMTSRFCKTCKGAIRPSELEFLPE